MKLILENWRKYVKEQIEPEQEKQYFGNSRNIAVELLKHYQPILQSASTSKEAQQEFDKSSESDEKIAADVSQKTGSQVSFLGKGAFRATFKVENDTVIKLNISKGSQTGQKMNEEDFSLGTDSRYGEIFPKAYEIDANKDWVILEQVTPIKDYFRISKYFPNDVLQGFRDPMRYYELFLESIRFVVGNNIKVDQFIQTATQKINNISRLFLKAIAKREVPLEEIIGGFKKLKTFNDITSAIIRYNMDINDALRPKNIGVGQDGRFVILDSSIKKSLESGREIRGQ